MTSQARRAWVHAAHVQFAGVDRLARVVAFGAETILGRDLLNITVTRLHGPRLTLSFLQRKQAGIRSSER